MIKGLPEYKEEQKHFDSLSKYHAFANFSIGVTEMSPGKIVYATIQEQLDDLQRIAYVFKYDKDLKRIISIEKRPIENKWVYIIM